MSDTAPDISAAEEIAKRLPLELRAQFNDNFQVGHLNYSANTRRVIDTQWRVWIRYADATNISVLTPHLPEIAAYLDLASETRKQSSVGVFTFALRRLYDWAALPNPLETESGRILLQRVRGKTSNVRRTKAPIRIEELVRILNNLSKSSIRDLRDAAIISLAYEAMLGPGELVALDLGNIWFHPDGNASIAIESRRADTPGLLRRNLTAATSERMRLWIQAAGITSGRVFRGLRGPASIHPRVTECFNDAGIRRRIKICCQRAGLAPRGFTGMSAIVGATVDLVSDGASLRAVARAGRYDSLTMVTRYTEHLGEAEDIMHKMLTKRQQNLQKIEAKPAMPQQFNLALSELDDVH